jgi:hypothetical protein
LTHPQNLVEVLPNEGAKILGINAHPLKPQCRLTIHLPAEHGDDRKLISYLRDPRCDEQDADKHEEVVPTPWPCLIHRRAHHASARSSGTAPNLAWEQNH